MKVVSRRTLREFWERHTDAEGALTEWHVFVSKADWNSTHDIKNDFPSADFLPSNRVVFDIRGNRYRLVTVVLLGPAKSVYIRFVGTHAEYDKIDAKKV